MERLEGSSSKLRSKIQSCSAKSSSSSPSLKSISRSFTGDSRARNSAALCSSPVTSIFIIYVDSRHKIIFLLYILKICFHIMKKVIVNTSKAPSAIGPYSQAVKAGNLLFVSGQIPSDPATGNLITGDIEAAAHQVMKNISAIV